MEIVKGFTDLSAERINRASKRLEDAAKRNKPGMPEAILKQIEGLINMAILGRPQQVEIAVGNSANECVKIRIATFPAAYGDIVDTTEGKKLRVVAFEECFGDLTPVRKDGKDVTLPARDDVSGS